MSNLLFERVQFWNPGISVIITACTINCVKTSCSKWEFKVANFLSCSRLDETTKINLVCGLVFVHLHSSQRWLCGKWSNALLFFLMFEKWVYSMLVVFLAICVVWWSTTFVQIKISLQFLNGLLWSFAQTFMVPRGWRHLTLEVPWLFPLMWLTFVVKCLNNY